MRTVYSSVKRVPDRGYRAHSRFPEGDMGEGDIDLVTGGCGFLGSAIVRTLVERGRRVRVLALADERQTTSTVSTWSSCAATCSGRARLRARRQRRDTGCSTQRPIYKAWMPDPTAMYEVNSRHLQRTRSGTPRRHEPVVYTASIVGSAVRAGASSRTNDSLRCMGHRLSYSRAKYHSHNIARDFAALGPGRAHRLPGDRVSALATSGPRLR